jgi:hypothetical protein
MLAAGVVLPGCAVKDRVTVPAAVAAWVRTLLLGDQAVVAGECSRR